MDTRTSDQTGMHPDVQKRLKRAHNRDLDMYHPPHAKFIGVDSSHSGETHVVVPETAHCSCPDAVHRTGPCWHLLYLATDESVSDDLREAVRDGIQSRLENYTNSANDILERAEDAHETAQKWSDATTAVFASSDSDTDLDSDAPDDGLSTWINSHDESDDPRYSWDTDAEPDEIDDIAGSVV